MFQVVGHLRKNYDGRHNFMSILKTILHASINPMCQSVVDDSLVSIMQPATACCP